MEKIYPYNHRITISNLSTAGQVTDPAPPKSALPGGTGPVDRFRKLQGLFVGAKRNFNGRRVDWDGKLQFFFWAPQKNGGTVFHLFSWWQQPTLLGLILLMLRRKNTGFSPVKNFVEISWLRQAWQAPKIWISMSPNESFPPKKTPWISSSKHFWRPYPQIDV